MDSCFTLVGAHPHGVAKTCNFELTSSKYGTWYNERVILQFMCVGSLAGVTYLRYTVLMSSNKSETAVHCCDPALSVLVMLVSRNVFHVVSALQSFAFIHFSLADQISFRSYVGSVCPIRSLQLVTQSLNIWTAFSLVDSYKELDHFIIYSSSLRPGSGMLSRNMVGQVYLLRYLVRGWTGISLLYLLYQAELFPDYKTRRLTSP